MNQNNTHYEYVVSSANYVIRIVKQWRKCHVGRTARAADSRAIAAA